MRPDSIVFGAAGFVGRALVEELLRRGHGVAAAVRGGGDRLASALAERDVPLDGLRVVTADITRPGLGLADDLADVRDVYNTAARFAFGLGVTEARAVNVTGALNVLDWAATLTYLRRVVHISGYRVSGGGAPDYRRLGAYEGSKREGDTAVRARAQERGIPLTIANPATVIGPGQFIGLASLVSDLWRGRLPAVPGGPEVFVPVVDLGYLAAFLADLPSDERTEGNAYWVLDEETPHLPDLVKLIAAHLGVPAPERTIPVGLLRRLPRTITGAEPETLSFLSADRYDTASAQAVARRPMPPVGPALKRWADDLVATGFGTSAPPRGPYGFHRVAGSATWLTGEREHPSHVLLHGLPLDSASWSEVVERLDAPVLAADLPGLGRSSPADGPLEDWLAELLRPVGSRPTLVAHSLACGPAVRHAAAHPDGLSRLVLVAPAFLQAPVPWPRRSSLAVPVLRRMTSARLARALGVPESPATASAAANLARPGHARRVVAALRAARAGLASTLSRVTVPVDIVVGSADPLVTPVDRPVTVIEGAGHYPQLTHPDDLVHALAGAGTPPRIGL
ncbi:alpha/beta fold hydrolase [Nonomuraea sp. C10]|uniref:alpha/beta fold hydrolase n=1 Tax=Nonomuraea sp. C10 TaxID=2600577 RepID=UPI0011CDAA84|nr:alpha/beta fold hydrolase [Nonomuraea sp. C10]TXK34500.1 alpha/beta fold hydrolase [Nonomuraea sp. C10]